jgi:hypothetical protein
MVTTAGPRDAALNGPPARTCLSVGAVKRRIADYGKCRQHRTDSEIRKWDSDLAQENRDAETAFELWLSTQNDSKAIRA